MALKIQEFDKFFTSIMSKTHKMVAKYIFTLKQMKALGANKFLIESVGVLH